MAVVVHPVVSDTRGHQRELVDGGLVVPRHHVRALEEPTHLLPLLLVGGDREEVVARDLVKPGVVARRHLADLRELGRCVVSERVSGLQVEFETLPKFGRRHLVSSRQSCLYFRT